MSNKNDIATTKGSILIADDNVDNLKVLSNILESNGYKVRMAQDGEQVLQSLELSIVDIILLDIHMPRMDGYEACKRIKADMRYKEIPIIFISALTDTFNKVEAFNIGAADYLTKPIHMDELLSRIHTHLSLISLHKELIEKNKKLQELEILRDNLFHMIVHDMRSPLAGLVGNLDMIEMDCVENENSTKEMISSSIQACQNLNNMINSLLDVYKLEQGKMQLFISKFTMSQCIDAVIKFLGASTNKHDIDIKIENDDEISGDYELIKRVLQNLISNALKYTPLGKKIEIEVNKVDDNLRVKISDEGHGIPKKYHDKIFEKFGQAESKHVARQASTGLGLAFCKLVIEAHGGKIDVDSKEGEGSIFWFKLPLNLD